MRVSTLLPIVFSLALVSAAPVNKQVEERGICIFGFGDCATSTTSVRATSTTISATSTARTTSTSTSSSTSAARTTSASTSSIATSIRITSSSVLPTSTSVRATSTVVTSSAASPTATTDVWSGCTSFSWDSWKGKTFNGFSLDYVKAWYYDSYGLQPIPGMNWSMVTYHLNQNCDKTTVSATRTSSVYSHGCSKPIATVYSTSSVAAATTSSRAATTTVISSSAVTTRATSSSAPCTTSTSTRASSSSAPAVSAPVATSTASSTRSSVVVGTTVSSVASSSASSSLPAASSHATSSASATASSVVTSSSASSTSSASSASASAPVGTPSAGSATGSASNTGSASSASSASASTTASASSASASSTPTNGSDGSLASVIGAGAPDSVSSTASSAASASASAASASSSGTLGTGSGANSGSSIPNYGVPGTLTANGLYDYGCVAEIDQRLLRKGGVNLDSMTIEVCQSYCYNLGWPVAGVEYGSECYCGDLSDIASLSQSWMCNMPCAASSSEICGGPQALNLYVNPAITVATVTLPAGFAYAGCYTEGSNFRALSTTLWQGKATNTVESCSQACAAAGFSIAGMEYSSECYCSNAFETPGDGATGPTRVDDSNCSFSCPGDLAEDCGAGNFLSVYSSLSLPLPGLQSSS